MPTSTKVKNLNINELTEAQYDAAVQGGVIGANELSVLTDVNYAELSDLATVATSGSYNDLTNKPTIPTVGNGTITITQGGVTKGTFTTNQSGNTTIDVDAGGGSGLPDQTGHSGEFLTTDGTDASWSDEPLINRTTDTSTGVGKSIYILNVGNGVVARNKSNALIVGSTNSDPGNWGTVVGIDAGTYSNATNGVVYGYGQRVSANYAIQIGGVYGHTNSDANTFKVGNNNGNFEIMSADGTIPEARLADTTNAQQGDVLTLDANGNAVWQAGGGGSGLPSQTGNAGKFLTTDGTDASWSDKPLVNTATSDGSLTIFGTPITRNYSYSISIGYDSYVLHEHSVAIGCHARTEQYSSSCVALGYYTQCRENYTIAIGTQTIANKVGAIAIGTYCGNENASTNGKYTVGVGHAAQTQANFSIAIGANAHAKAVNAIQFGTIDGVTAVNNTDANTVKIANANGNFEIMSADGTIPTARLTKVNTTITLAAAGWSSNTQTVSVTGMTADGVVMVSPAPTDQSAYTSAGILCTAQAAGTLTFTCDTVPSGDLSVNIVML